MASNNERLLAAAKGDSEDLLLKVFEVHGSYDINFQDGLGNTALHYAARNGSLTVLEHLLEHDGCDVDIQNRIERATPLHLALQNEDEDERLQVVTSLLEAGADVSIKNKNGSVAADLVGQDEELRELLRESQATKISISHADIASDDDEEEDEDEDEDE